MITGDNPLTACYVAKQLGMAPRETMLILNPENLFWESVMKDTQIMFGEESVP